MQKLAITLILLCMTSVVVEGSEWTGTWGCSIYSDSQLDANIGNATLRQVVRVSIPGNQVRLKFSNLYGTSSLVMQKVHLAQSAGGHSINTSTDIAVTFGGSESVTIPAGGAVTSDALIYNLPALTNMAITIYFGSVPSTKSGHVGSRTTSYYQSGDAVAASSLTSPTSSVRWYVIAGIDVYREDAARAVVAYGDSITDGYGTTTDAQNRWTDLFATRLQGVTETSDVGVLNQGIGGTLAAGSGLSRLNRDVLQQTDVRYLVILYGVNDILFADSSSSTIISAYQTIITNAHNNDILVYGGTITPFGGYGSYTPARETVRQQVNTWIRNTSAAAGGFDAVIDFDVALRDPSDNTRLLPVYSNDGLHPSIAGYQAMADAINLGLFSLDVTPPSAPTGLTATAQSYRRIDLDWNDNGESDLSHYNVKRSMAAGGPYSQIAIAATSTYSDTNLAASTTYYYVVTSVDISSNESAPSAEAMDTTHVLPDDTEPPTPNPATWASVPSAVSGSVINMTATTGSDTYDPVQYYFDETSGNPGGTDSGWQTGSSYSDTGLSPGTHYTYRVQMRDDLGNTGSYSISQSAATLETLKVDFNGNNFGTVIVQTQAGFEAYNARNEVQAEFVPVNYSAFGTTITVTPTWASGAVAAAMQSWNRGNSYGYSTASQDMLDLVVDWIGTDQREVGDPMTLTISGLPAGTYSWRSYHHDTQNQTGHFSVTVNDAAGSATTTGLQVSSSQSLSDLTLADVTKFDTQIVSNGVNAVALVFEATDAANYNTMFVMNGFELAIIGITNCQQVQSLGFRLDADLNGDCEIERADLVLLADQWLSTSPAAVAPNYSPDLVADNKINLVDFAVMAQQWLVCNDPEAVGCIVNW